MNFGKKPSGFVGLKAQTGSLIVLIEQLHIVWVVGVLKIEIDGAIAIHPTLAGQANRTICVKFQSFQEFFFIALHGRDVVLTAENLNSTGSAATRGATEANVDSRLAPGEQNFSVGIDFD